MGFSKCACAAHKTKFCKATEGPVQKDRECGGTTGVAQD